MKSPGSSPLATRVAALLLADLLLVPSGVLANPQGGVVHSGSATIVGEGSRQVDVHQHTQGAVLSWERFDIDAGEVTNFRQPNANAVAINRILAQDPSRILGALNANGNVYLINPNGFLFGANARINTRGFVAATSADAKELVGASGGFDASAQSAPGARIENHGRIETGPGGFVYLIAPKLENGKDAVVTTPEGEVLLAAGASVTLTDDPGGRGLAVRYTAPGEPGGEAVNLGRLVADGGMVRVRGDLVRQAGVVQANAVRERNGAIELYARDELALADGSVTAATGGAGAAAGGEVLAYSERDAVMASGATIDVSGGAEGGDGGFAELSSERNLALAGTFRASAREGARKGEILIDPEILTITGETTFVGAGAIVAEADERIELADDVEVRLSDPAVAGDGTAARQSLTLRSGRHISFGSNARIVDDGTGAGGAKVWDVNLVAGADLASPDLLALRAGSDGGVYLSGAQFNADGSVRSLRTYAGAVELTRGDLRVRAASDLVIGNGGGLRNVFGLIDVIARRDVRFRATSRTAPDGVIENGGGDIRIDAGGSVLLGEGGSVTGNAAIRTRGVTGVDGQGRTTITDGGDIVIRAGGDVDAGAGNRWLEPGPNLTHEGYAEIAEELGVPAPPAFDPLPVVREGILGIGTEAGGNVTIVAGGSVRTGLGSGARSGGTAQGLGTQYNGGHIGVFGRPVVRVEDPVFGGDRNVAIEGAPESQLTVIAGDAIEGDFLARFGDAVLRAGYQLADGVDVGSLALADVDAALVASASALAGPLRGWLGTLTRPLTVDLMEASVSGAGRNGVAIRGIENPSLVYPPAINSQTGVSAVPTYRPGDGATLRSSHGDVYLVGNDVRLPVPGLSEPQNNQLVRVLPPNVHIETERGDLVLLNDFVLYPSERGGLSLDIGGRVRTAGLSASSAALLAVDVETTGRTGDIAFSLPAGTRLRDPETGIEYTLSAQVAVGVREAARQAGGSVVFQVTPQAAGGSVSVPAGTRVTTADGRIYRVVQTATLPAPEARISRGEATFRVEGAGAREAIRITRGTELVDASGTRFRVTEDGLVLPGQVQITLPVEAIEAGVDVAAFRLGLASPIAGIASATNENPTARPLEITARVQAEDAGASGNALALAVTALLDPVPGVRLIANRAQLGGGSNLAPTGVGSSPTSNFGPGARASVLGPAGEAPPGATLVVVDPSALPPGVVASEILVRVTRTAENAAVRPALFRELRPGEGGALRGDPAPGTVATLSTSEAWIREGEGISATLIQSDAAPAIDRRDVSGAFDYYAYLTGCRSGLPCQAGTIGDGPTHSGDLDPSVLRSLGGFERVGFDLAKAAFVLSGDAGPDGRFGTADDGADGSIVDLSLLTQHTDASQETRIWVPIGDASFGADAPAPGVDPDLGAGLQVAGPGRARLLVGVLPNAPLADTDGNGRIDPAESTGDFDGDGVVDRDEWRGASDVFTRIDESQRLYATGAGGALFATRQILPGGGDGALTPAETPWVPSGRGGELRLAAAIPPERAAVALGVSAIGNIRNERLPIGSADLFVAAAGDVDLGSRGALETHQGSTIRVQSVGGEVVAGDALPGFDGRRGIVTLFREPGFGDRPVAATGGGPIGVDADGDFDIGGLALAALSGSDITVYSRGSSIDAGQSSPFSDPRVFVDPSGTVNVTYQGGGIFSQGGDIALFAKEDIRIGAGITGAGITIDAGGSLVGGSGSLSGTNVNINVSGTIGGSISASGSINVTGGSVSQGTSLSAGGIVAGAGAAGASASGGKVSAELSGFESQIAATTNSGTALGSGAGGAPRGLIIEVTSRVLDEEEE